MKVYRYFILKSKPLLEYFISDAHFKIFASNVGVPLINIDKIMPTINENQLDIVGTVYHLVTYTQSNKIHKVF